MAEDQVEDIEVEASEDEETVLVKAETFSTRAVHSERVETVTALLHANTEKIQGVITPPYDFEHLYLLYESSSVLRPNIDAYVTNIDSFGHHYTPTIDLASDDADTRISNALLYEQMLEVYHEHPEVSPMDIEPPSPEEVKAHKEKLRRLARFEYAKLRTFFDFSNPDGSFTDLRRWTRQDLEVTGNAFWEVTRNGLGEISHFYYVSVLNMRLTALDKESTCVKEPVKTTDISWHHIPRPKRFRRYVQLGHNKKPSVFFKELGDPRVISRTTGFAYESIELLEQAEGESAKPATEMIHFKLHTPASDYGVPRWIGNLPAVLGSRELDEVNLGFFKNNSVPPLALLCAGGRFGKGIAQKISEYIDEHLKGSKGHHKILVLEAEGQKSQTGTKAIPKVEFVPLRDAQQTDAQFQEYDKRNDEKVAKSFRLPRMLRGDDSQINRATAWASLRFAEEQVFEPERESFDGYINRRILSSLGITFWLFRSNAPVTRDPEAMAAMIVNLVTAGILLPSEARTLASDIFNRTFLEISEDWTNKPLPLTLAQLRSEGDKGGIFTAKTPIDDSVETAPTNGEKPKEPIAATTQSLHPLSPLRSLGSASADQENL